MASRIALAPRHALGHSDGHHAMHPDHPHACANRASGRARLARLLPAALLLAVIPGWAAEPGALTIYRCTGSDGTVTVGNLPCADGEQARQRVMQRPRDPAPASAAAPASVPAGASVPPATPATAPARRVRGVSVRPPQPMYACTTPEGDQYLSGEDRRTLRWVPLWVAGRSLAAPTAPYASPARPGAPPASAAAVAATGTWVEDSCELLPPEEACRHLSDRRYEILRIYHAATPGEREALDAEQEALDARLANDCPGS